MTDLSRRHGFSDAAVSVSRYRKCPRVDRLVAKTLGVPLHELYPRRYDEDGCPIKRIRRPESSARRLNQPGARAAA